MNTKKIEIETDPRPRTFHGPHRRRWLLNVPAPLQNGPRRTGGEGIGTHRRSCGFWTCWCCVCLFLALSFFPNSLFGAAVTGGDQPVATQGKGDGGKTASGEVRPRAAEEKEGPVKTEKQAAEKGGKRVEGKAAGGPPSLPDGKKTVTTTKTSGAAATADKSKVVPVAKGTTASGPKKTSVATPARGESKTSPPRIAADVRMAAEARTAAQGPAGEGKTVASGQAATVPPTAATGTATGTSTAATTVPRPASASPAPAAAPATQAAAAAKPQAVSSPQVSPASVLGPPSGTQPAQVAVPPPRSVATPRPGDVPPSGPQSPGAEPPKRGVGATQPAQSQGAPPPAPGSRPTSAVPAQPVPASVKPTASSPATPQAAAAPSQPTKDTRYITIDFDNVDIQVFVRFISEMTGKNFIFDEKVKGKVTVLSPRKITVDEAYRVFLSVLDVNGYAAMPAGDVTKIVPIQQAKEKQTETRTDGKPITPEDRMVTQILSLEHASPDEIKKVLDPLIPRTSVLVPYAPTGMLIVNDLASNIKKLQEIVAAVDKQGVGEQISYIPMKFATATDIVKALTALFQQQKGVAPVKFVADDRTNAVLFMASENATTRVKELIAMMDKGINKDASLLHIYKLQNASAEDLAKVLMNIPKSTAAGAPAAAGAAGQAPLSKNVQITADKATNALIITADRADYVILESVIKKLDQPRPMVYIEALIMEVGVTKDFRLGVQWQLLKDIGAITGLETATGEARAAATGGFAGSGGLFPTADATTGLVTKLPAGFSIGVLGAGIKVGSVTFPTIGAMLQALSEDSDISILSTPQLLTLDHEEAEINVGENVPYITRQDQTNTGVTATNYSNYEYKDVGVLLKLTPHISEENHIRLKIDQQLTKVKGQTAEDKFRPTTLKRAAKTTVVVKDKETVVIGGLIDDTTNVSTYKIPLLGDIPILGWLFKYQSKTKDKRNLFTFITPHIIRTQEEAAALTKTKTDAAGVLEEGVIRMYDPKRDKPRGEGS